MKKILQLLFITSLSFLIELPAIAWPSPISGETIEESMDRENTGILQDSDRNYYVRMTEIICTLSSTDEISFRQIADDLMLWVERAEGICHFPAEDNIILGWIPAQTKPIEATITTITRPSFEPFRNLQGEIVCSSDCDDFYPMYTETVFDMHYSGEPDGIHRCAIEIAADLPSGKRIYAQQDTYIHGESCNDIYENYSVIVNESE
jgi:hypothetical protein